MKKILSFTTLPSRIDKMEKIVRSLSNQSLMPDEIILWVPRRYERLNQIIEEVPGYFNHYPVEVKFCDVDYGPFTKLRPSLDYCNDDDIIVTCDDDTLYPKHWFKNLVEYSQKYPDKCIGYRGRVFDKKDRLRYEKSKVYFGSGWRSHRRVDLVTGTWGVLYKKQFFDSYIYSDDFKKMFMVDDIWISGNLAKAGTERIIIKDPGFNKDNPSADGLYLIDSLWEENESAKNNSSAIGFFIENFKHKKQFNV